MEVRVLGPLEVVAGGVSIPIGGGRQRKLLAILLLHANEFVASDRLIDELWGEDRPETAAKALQENTDLSPEEIVKRSLTIAGELCIYTNLSHIVETLE